MYIILGGWLSELILKDFWTTRPEGFVGAVRGADDRFSYQLTVNMGLVITDT